MRTEKIVSSAVVTPAVIDSKPLKSVNAVSTKIVFVSVAATAAMPNEIAEFDNQCFVLRFFARLFG